MNRADLRFLHSAPNFFVFNTVVDRLGYDMDEGRIETLRLDMSELRAVDKIVETDLLLATVGQFWKNKNCWEDRWGSKTF